MSDVTTRFGITEPASARTDTADVPVYIRSTNTQLEALAMQFGHGTLAARPAAGVQGRIYVATDQTPVLAYYDTGSGWFQLGISNDAAPRLLLQTQGYVDSTVNGPGYICKTYDKPIPGGTVYVPTNPIPMFDIHAAELQVPGKTAKLSLEAVLACNGTAPGVFVSFNIAPIASVGGTANNFFLTVGAQALGTSFTTPVANSVARQVVEGNLPADGQYVFGCATNINPAAGTILPFTLKARVRYV